LLAFRHDAVVASGGGAVGIAAVATRGVAVIANLTADTVRIRRYIGDAVAAERQDAAVSTGVGIFVAVTGITTVRGDAHAADAAVFIEDARVVERRQLANSGLIARHPRSTVGVGITRFALPGDR
jgi:hypothetical protein